MYQKVVETPLGHQGRTQKGKREGGHKKHTQTTKKGKKQTKMTDIGVKRGPIIFGSSMFSHLIWVH